MNLNQSNLGHPRVQREIHAAMMRSVEASKGAGRFGSADIKNAAGKTIMQVIHWRGFPDAIQFLANGERVTDKVLKALRAIQ